MNGVMWLSSKLHTGRTDRSEGESEEFCFHFTEFEIPAGVGWFRLWREKKVVKEIINLSLLYQCLCVASANAYGKKDESQGYNK